MLDCSTETGLLLVLLWWYWYVTQVPHSKPVLLMEISSLHTNVYSVRFQCEAISRV